MSKKRFLVLFGPNILREVEKDTVGAETYDSLVLHLKAHAESMSVCCDVLQSNWEGELIDAIHSCIAKYDGVVIDAGAFTHYSYAIRDAIGCVRVPFIEAHMENLFALEDFRNRSVLAPVCAGQIGGLGADSYLLALEALVRMK